MHLPSTKSVWENFKACPRQSVVQQSAVPKDNSSDTTWEGGITVLLGNKVSICWFCFWGWTLAKRKLHKALVCLALFETCFSACGTRDRYPFLLSLVKHISKAEKYLGKPLDKTFQVWNQDFFPRQPAPSFCAWLWRFVCYLFWQRLEIGVEDQFLRFPISVLWWLCDFFHLMFSFLFPSQKHNGVGLGVFVALPGQSTIRCFGRLGSGEGTKLLVFDETFWGLNMNLQTPDFDGKTPGFYTRELTQKVFELIEAPNGGYPENKNAW